jgi:hypothetical protein
MAERLLYRERLLRYAAEIEQNQVPRVLADRSNPLEGLPEAKVIRQYRLDTASIYQLVEDLTPALERPTNRGRPLPILIQVLVFLRFGASGAFYGVISDLPWRVSIGAVCTNLHRTARAVADLCPHFVQFPTRAEAQRNKISFYNIAGEFHTVHKLTISNH